MKYICIKQINVNNKNPTGTVLYLIEQAIKEYRKVSQRNISKIVKDITIDQCLVLIILNNDAEISQNELANLIFKDNASITRMIELMVRKDYLNRTIHKEDRRKFNLEITEKGMKTLELINSIVQLNRETALNGLSLEEINILYKTLNKIITNCKQ
ncbi:MarR family transcriptional regulator [Flavobacterium bomense]|uniref:MarR family transcriptional regulator n=1 Tax=Flavobacterium bomense TaxID=2497483 RepID=A0A432CJA4_9FLAO|nr:MarR family transcriptional regulator [Flavobacterium bomense]